MGTFDPVFNKMILLITCIIVQSTNNIQNVFIVDLVIAKYQGVSERVETLKMVVLK